MPWTSKWTAQFAKPVVMQIMAIINRDIAAALADVNAAANYPPFAEYDLAHVPIVNFPAILVVPESLAFDAEEQNARHYTLRLLASLACTHQDPNQVAAILEDYIRAVDEVLNSAWWLTTSDFYSAAIPLPSPPYPPGSLAPGLAGPSGKGTLEQLFIEGHAYAELRQLSSGLFAKAATSSLLIEVEEV